MKGEEVSAGFALCSEVTRGGHAYHCTAGATYRCSLFLGYPQLVRSSKCPVSSTQISYSIEREIERHGDKKRERGSERIQTSSPSAD